MKKYTSISKDLSTLIDQVVSHTAGLTIGATDPHYHPLGDAADLVESIPAVATAFADENLSIMKMSLFHAYYNPMGFLVAAPAAMSGVVVPFLDAVGATLKLYTVNPGAQPFTDPTIGDVDLYDSDDCTLIETISVTADLIFVPSGTIWTLEPAGQSAPSRFIFIGFNEDISSYFAD
jgi:hypothetical protein